MRVAEIMEQIALHRLGDKNEGVCPDRLKHFLMDFWDKTTDPDSGEQK